MEKAVRLTRNRLTKLITILFLVSFSPDFVVHAEEVLPAAESTPTTVIEVPSTPVDPVPTPEVVAPIPIVEPAPEIVAPVPAPIVEPIPEVIPVPIPITEPTSAPVISPIPALPPIIDPTTQENLDETFANPNPDDLVEEDPISAPTDPDKIFSEPTPEVTPVITPDPSSLTKEDIKKLDDVFTNIDIKKEIIKEPEIVETKKEKVEALHSCAFDDFSIEIGSNETKSTPILLKKSGPNKKFGLKVGSVPEGIEITFSTNNQDFTSGENGSPVLAQKFSELETKAVNKDLIFTESVLEEKDPQFKNKKEQKIDEREVVAEEISIKSSSNLQKGSFNIPIIYAESNEVIGEQNFESNSTIETNCQFNLIVK